MPNQAGNPKPPARRIRRDGNWTPSHLDAAKRYARAIAEQDWAVVADGSPCPVILEEIFVAWYRPSDEKPGKIKQKFHIFRRKAWRSWREWVLDHSPDNVTLVNMELSDLLNPRSPHYEEIQYKTLSRLRRHGYDAASI